MTRVHIGIRRSMRRRVVNALAVFGAVSLLTAATNAVVNRTAPVMIVGRAFDADRRPLTGLSVYLDRGTNLIERYVSDSTGLFQLPLFPREPHRATWLICARGGVPMVGRPQLDHLGTAYYTYDYTALGDSVWRFYRASGWTGPVPRECPRGADSVGWRYPASAKKSWGAYTTKEPDWARYPGPPAFPDSI